MNLNYNVLPVAGADGLAVVGAFCGAKDPFFAAHELRTIWEKIA
jgi:thiamine monophosphate synthase